MTATRLDIVAIGNAIVDVIATAEEDFLAAEQLAKGSMQLISAQRAIELYSKMGPGREISGGSAANTVAGMASLGRRCGFIGQVADDQLGKVFSHDIRAIDVAFTTPARDGEPPTAQCLILVTPDGQRTMNTFLGASQFLPVTAIDGDMIANAEILYLEGYLWDPDEPRAAMKSAISIARKAGRKVALTLSDAFCIERHRASFLELLDNGEIDILFANEAEMHSLMESDHFDESVAAVACKVPLLVVTRGPDGALAVMNGVRTDVHAEPVDKVVDTTGAGDLFAAGFLAGHVEGRSVADSLRMGAICAAEVISHYGPRPEADLSQLVQARLG